MKDLPPLKDHKAAHSLRALIPSSFDWVSMGVVTAVKNQVCRRLASPSVDLQRSFYVTKKKILKGACNAGWAFSATSNIESLKAIKYTGLVALSPQQIIDCDKTARYLTLPRPYIKRIKIPTKT